MLNAAHLDFEGNALTDLPTSLVHLKKLRTLDLSRNPLNPELAAADNEGLDTVKRYLRAKAETQVPLNEAKLILIGEGEVGKSCLLGALRGDPWEEGRPTTHGIEIKQVLVTDPKSSTEITLNDRQEIWDLFGRETVVDFFQVESKPDAATGERKGVAGLKEAIARVTAALPEEAMGVLQNVRRQLGAQEARIIGRLNGLDAATRELVSKV